MQVVFEDNGGRETDSLADGAREERDESRLNLVETDILEKSSSSRVSKRAL